MGKPVASSVTAATAATTPRIFISHSHLDDALGQRLAQDLRTHFGADAVWYDASGGLHGGDDWWQRIVAELSSRDTFLLLLSPEALASKWVAQEMSIAFHRYVEGKMRLLPLHYRPCNLPADWVQIQWLPICDPQQDAAGYARDFARLLGDLTPPTPLSHGERGEQESHLSRGAQEPHPRQAPAEPNLSPMANVARNVSGNVSGAAPLAPLSLGRGAGGEVSPSHKAIKAYYEKLAEYRGQGITNEQALRPAFQMLLDTLAHEQKWTLVLEQHMENGAIPDGTLVDKNGYTRGYWEAKDPGDDLEAEIKKKIARGYPLRNIIFEDTRRAVLFQNYRRYAEYDLAQPAALADLLTTFFGYIEAPEVNFERAVEKFKAQVPELARGLRKRIQEEHEAGIDNLAFATAFESFLALCRSSLDPNISRDAVDDMLVQHLLTERLFRTVFDNDEFTKRNVIAAEIEKVITGLTSRQFNRKQFLQSLDHFYLAIEEAARGLDDWSQKQRFLNMVYERFFQGYSVKEADTHGIVYTPQEIVDFMCASVEEVLRRDFGSSIATPGVQILDPCTGTGNFIVNLLRRIGQQAPQNLTHKYREDLFANEIMLLPYYIASMNIEHEYFNQTHTYQAFEGLAFVDTLGLEGTQMELFSEANTRRIQREKAAQIQVIIGNPPYNMGQENENDNNKNRAYKVLDGRIRGTYSKDSQATLNNKLYDPYVRFFRWATDRLQGRDGIVCFVSNNSFVDQIAFDGMRKHLLQDFTHVYHLDLHGNVRKNPKLSGTTHNVFGIQVGVGITIAVRSSAHTERTLYYFRVPEDWRKEQKLAFLRDNESIETIEWQELEPDEQETWLTEGMRPEFASFMPMGTKQVKPRSGMDIEAVFRTYSLGVVTSRDSYSYSFDRGALGRRAANFVEVYNSAVDKARRLGNEIDVSALVDTSDPRIKWSRQLKASLAKLEYSHYANDHIRRCLYRPFTALNLYFDDFWIEERYQQPLIFPVPASEAENTSICLTDLGSEKPFMLLMSNCLVDYHLVGAGSSTQCFPYYTYTEDGSNRRENITDWALAQFRAAYGDDVSKRDIFDYVYGLLHHPIYRERYAENLKRELPRIPLAPGRAAFETLRETGAALARLHLNYEQVEEYPLTWHTNQTIAQDWRVEKMRLTPDKTALVYNDWLTLEGIPPETFAYRLGNRSALEWVIDQYRVSTDSRSQITSDPNRRGDGPLGREYIARLIGRVISVSVETARLVGEVARVDLTPQPPLPRGEGVP